MLHIPFHRSHLSTLEYLRSTQTNNERPQSTIKDITAKSNSRQDLGNLLGKLLSNSKIVGSKILSFGEPIGPNNVFSSKFELK